MVNKMRSFVALALLMLVTTLCAQVTTSGIDGVVTADKEPVIGATVLAIHEPSGTRYGTITNVDGRFALQGMRAGGPYKIEISYIGYRTETYSGVQLQLGETFRLNVALKESTQMMDELVVIGEKAGLESSRTGAATSFNLGAIQSIPTISRSVTDITRLTPQASVNNSNGSISFAGANNRYNSFQIDGAMNNDVFGLAANGMNGGQASTQPVSMETIEQVQVSIAPFDVRQSGFTGGGVNAITKSGTNKFHGSAYFYGNNQNLIGTEAGKMENGKKRSKFQDQNDYQYGLTLGGPILKNKLFFFANYEKTDKSYPTSNNIGEGSYLTKEDADKILARMQELTGGKYTGNFDPRDVKTESDKVGVKVDWNINDRHKLTARYSFVKASDDAFSRTVNAMRASDNGYAFNNRTASYILELNSRVGDKNPINNEFRVSYVTVRDNRQPFGDPFPNFYIKSVNNASINLGTEYSSCANALDQDILTLTDNLTWLVGKHNLTFGTHNELYRFENLFIQNLYGSYTFDNLEGFLNGTVSAYSYGQAKENITGNPNWAPEFGAAQLGLYVQDQWEVTNNLSLTYGIRMDIPMFMDTPSENVTFNEWDIAKQWGVKTNREISSNPLFSPRAGFRWNIDREKGMLLRGGVGIFTGRIPFVWLSNSFSNTGVEFMKYYYSYPSFSGFHIATDPYGQLNMLQNAKTDNTTEVDVFSKDFKFSQNLRFNLAYEMRLPFDVKMTLEGMYSKTLNDILYRNINIEESGETVASKGYAPFDQRAYFKKINGDYTRVMLLDNTSKGYTYNLSAKLEKSFDFGLDAMVAYTYGQSKSLNSGGSSVAWSNFRYNYTVGHPNEPELGYSNFNIPHRVVGMLTYNKKWNNNLRTSVSLIYNGQSGTPYNVYYYGDLNGDGSDSNDLLFIPTDAQIDQMKFVPTGKLTADQQRADLKAWLGDAAYLKDHRGEVYKRNADNAPWENHFDFRFMQEFSLKVGKEYHSLQLSFDILNVGNLLNREWGLETTTAYYAPISYGNLTNADGVKEYGFQYTSGANNKPLKSSDLYSRWRAQIGVRYSF